jgi:hypothetical protein
MLRGELPSFRDHEDYFVPLRAFTADALRAGELPLWNAFNASGEPWLANPQTGVFYPPAWIVSILPFETGYVAFLTLHLAILGLGLRRLFLLRASDASATLVASALIVGGPILSLLDVSNNLATFAWTPWILARALDRSRLPGIPDSLLLALSFLGGEPLLAAVTWLAWTGIALVRLGRAAIPLVSWRLFLAACLSAAQLLPFVAMLVGSDRVGGLAPDVAFRNSMAVGDWLAVLVSPAGVQPGIGRSQLFLPSLYLSPIVVYLGLASFADDRSKRFRRGWCVVLASSIIFASGSQFPLVGRMFEGLQLTVSRYPVKFALFGFVAIGVLCSLGFDRLHALSVRARLACGVVAVCLFLAAQTLHRSPFTVVASTGLIVGLMWIAGFIVLLAYATRLDTDARLLLVCVLLPVVLFESVAASRFLLGSSPWPFERPYAVSFDEEQRVMRLEQLDSSWTGPAHVRDRIAWMGGYLNLLSRQHDASTAAPVVDRRYSELHDAALSAPRMDLLDFLSVRYVLTERDLSPFGYPVVAGYGGVSVFERPGSRPLLTAEFAPRPVIDPELAYDVLMTPAGDSGDPARITGVGLTNVYPSRVPQDAVSRTRSMRFTFDAVHAEVEVSHPALIVLNQRMSDGWSVTVDDEPRQAVVANALFRGVEVSEGAHSVVWSYRSRSLRAGIPASIAVMLVLALEGWRMRASRKKMSRPFHSEHA